MRGKIAKALRRAARAALPAGAPERKVLMTLVHQKYYPWLMPKGLDINGVLNSIRTGSAMRPVHTGVNSPDSVRGLYRAMKRDYKKGLGRV